MLPTLVATIRLRARLAVALAVLLLGGCLAAPKPASKITPQPVTQASYQGVKTDLVMPAGYWKQAGTLDAGQTLRNAHRAVITEFAVELIDLQAQGPFERQMAVSPPPMIFGPLVSLDGLAFVAAVSANVVGLGRNNVQMTDDKQQALAGTLLAFYEGDLRRRGLALVPMSTLAASAGYAELKPKPTVKSSFFKLLNPVGSDTGVVLRSRIMGAPGLGVVTCSVSDRAEAESKILRDMGADLAIAVRLRVGSFHKKAALEQGSVIRLTTVEGGATTFTARHSILSDADVISTPHFKVFTGHVEPVVADDFIRELERMLPMFLDLAIREPISSKGQTPLITRLPPVEPVSVR